MSSILMTLFLSMVQILFAYMKCSWDHYGRTFCYCTFFFNSLKIYLDSDSCYVFFFYNRVPSIRDSKTWSTGGIEGVHRFLGRTWRLIVGSPLSDGSYKEGTMATDDEPTFEQFRALHRCIAKVIILPYIIKL